MDNLIIVIKTNTHSTPKKTIQVFYDMGVITKPQKKYLINYFKNEKVNNTI
jgi:hypothetical protein